MLHFELPWPPSVNTLYRAIPRGKHCQNILSAKGRAYFDQAKAYFDYQGTRPEEPISSHVELKLFLHPPNKRIIDIDNRQKAVIDALVKCGVLEDDSVNVVRQIHTYYCSRVTDGSVVVEIHDCSEYKDDDLTDG